MIPNDSIKNKIMAYFNGQLSSKEEDDLFHWIKENKDHQAFFNKLKAELDPETIDHPLLKNSFAELKNRLFIHEQVISTQSGKIRQLNFSLQKIAAIFIFALVLGFGAAYLLFKGPEIKSQTVWFETKVPRGEKSQVILPDGSLVWLNSESQISYPSNFIEGHRQVKLSGEAYFEVAKLNGKDFTVETHDYNIRVLGTKFNVMAYRDFGRTETSLIEGKIEIQKGDHALNVTPGQTVTFKHNQFDLKSTNTTSTVRWKDNIFDFDQITFNELTKRLERWYDVKIDIKNPKLNGIVYSGIFKNEETIEEVLNAIQLTLPISYTRVDFRKFVIDLKQNKQ